MGNGRKRTLGTMCTEAYHLLNVRHVFEQLNGLGHIHVPRNANVNVAKWKIWSSTLENITHRCRKDLWGFFLWEENCLRLWFETPSPIISQLYFEPNCLGKMLKKTLRRYQRIRIKRHRIKSTAQPHPFVRFNTVFVRRISLDRGCMCHQPKMHLKAWIGWNRRTFFYYLWFDSICWMRDEWRAEIVRRATNRRSDTFHSDETVEIGEEKVINNIWWFVAGICIRFHPFLSLFFGGLSMRWYTLFVDFNYSIVWNFIDVAIIVLHRSIHRIFFTTFPRKIPYMPNLCPMQLRLRQPEQPVEMCDQLKRLLIFH